MYAFRNFRGRRSGRYLIVVTLVAVSTALLTVSIASHAADTARKADDYDVAVSGVVTAVSQGVYTLDYGGTFTLDHGAGAIEVEMEDWNSPGETPMDLVGERVTVFGHLAGGLFEERRITARVIYFDALNAYYDAHDVDEEGLYRDPRPTPEPIRYGNQIGITGTVTTVSGNWFTLNTGDRTLRINTENLGTNVLDDRGLQRVDEGDRVTVYGETETSETDEIRAISILVNEEAPARP